MLMLALWMGCPGILAGQDRQPSSPNPQVAKQQQPAVHVVNGEDHQANARSIHKQINEDAGAGPINSKWPEWIGNSNWWLVIIGALTGGVIGWQSWETRKAAQGAKDSAKAALAQIRLMKDKERARIRIEFEDFDFGSFPELGKHEVSYKITLDGTTPATIMEQAILAEIPGYPREPGKFHFSLGLPYSFSPAMSPFRSSTIVHKNEWPAQPENSISKIQAVQQNLLAVVIKGYVLYRDIFGDCWKLGFHLRWRNNSFFDKDTMGGRWEWLGDNDNGEKPIDR
jgi:hypothetical protein